MSETVSNTTTPVTPKTSSLSTAVASMGVGGAFVVVLAWLLSLVHVTLPDQVSAALVTLVAAGAHYFQDRFMNKGSKE